MAESVYRSTSNAVVSTGVGTVNTDCPLVILTHWCSWKLAVRGWIGLH